MPSLRFPEAAFYPCFLACLACTLALFDGAFHLSLSQAAGLHVAALAVTAFMAFIARWPVACAAGVHAASRALLNIDAGHSSANVINITR